MRRFTVIPALVLSCVFGWMLEAQAAEREQAEEASATEFIRLQRDDDNQPLSLETATVRYVFKSDDDELIVDLIGVIHVADKPYYEELNKQFEEYDAVLYEMVKPEGVEVTQRRSQPSSNPIAMIQGMLPDMLELSSQLDEIDYGAENFVHADLSPEQMSEAIRKRGDNGTTVFLKIALEVLGQSMRQSQSEGGAAVSEFDLFGLMTDEDASLKMKRMMAEQFGSMGPGGAMLGRTLETILVADRNAAAMDVLADQINSGTKKLAIFYGAAHMPDFEKRLTAMGFERADSKWARAWDMTATAEPKDEQRSPLENILKLLAP